MNNHSDEIRISIKHLLQAVLMGWKSILLTVLVLAVLGGGFKGVTAVFAAKDPEIRAAEEEAYQEDLTAYETRKTELEMEIAMQEQALSRHQMYLTESVLMSIDPYNMYEGTLCLYISAETEGSNKTTTAAQLYQAALVSEQVVDKVAGALKVDGRYLREIMTVTVGDTGEDPATILNIVTKCQSEEQAERMLDMMEAELADLYELVTESVGEHIMTPAVRSIRLTADQDLMDTQNNALDRVENTRNDLAELQTQMSELSAPSMPTHTAGAIAKAALKYAVLFGIVGVLLAAVVICVKFITGDRVYSGRELEYRCGLRILGNVCACDRKKIPGLDRKLRRMEERPLPGDGEALKLAAAKIRGYAPEANAILLAGQADAQAVTELARKLDDPRFHVCGSLLTDPNAMEALRACDAVVLVEQCGVARYSTVNREIEMLGELGGELVGCLVIDG